MSTVDAALARAGEVLRNRSASAALDATLLLAQVLGCGRGVLAARGGQRLTERELTAFDLLVERRAAGEPVAYLTGRKDFWTLELEVTPDVLVPRAETELLVELALARLAGLPAPTILDLGTGSGAIALALARERPDARITAVDASTAALAVARRNAVRLGLAGIEFLEGDWYAPVAHRRFDAIIANPPYVADDDPCLQALGFEPRTALAGGPDGLAAIAAVCAGAPAQLRPAGLLIVEHGAAQGAQVRRLCQGAGLGPATTHHDLAGHERATLAPALAVAAG